MQEGFVHYLPIATTAISLAFLLVLIRRAALRAWPPHLVWWGIGVFFYGLGTLLESWITLGGNPTSSPSVRTPRISSESTAAEFAVGTIGFQL